MWMEIIKVRTPGANWKNRANDVIRRARKEIRGTRDLELGVFTHATLPDDLGLTLTWRRQPPSPGGSEFAAGLARELARAGLVDHSVWIAENEPSRG